MAYLLADYEYQAIHKTISKLRTKLFEVGICPDCLTEYVGPGDEGPFATCECGTTECYQKGLIQQLRDKT